MDRPSPLHLLDRRLLQAVVTGLSCVTLLPFARVESATFGWLPLWLVGLPLVAWLACRFMSKHGRAMVSIHSPSAVHLRRRSPVVQARRRRGVRVAGLPQRCQPPA